MARLAYMFLLMALATVTCTTQVWAQDSRSDAETAIVSARYQLDYSFQRVEFFWQNVTDSAQADITSDLAKSYHRFFESMREYDAGFFNNSIRFARLSRFFAVRAEYRVFLDLASAMILRANETIASIPAGIPEPQYAEKLLATAKSTYLNYHYGYLLDFQSGEVEEYEINSLFEAEKMLFSNENSAFNYASQAMRDAQSHRVREEVSLRKRTLEINSQFSLAVMVVLLFAAVASIYSIRPLILALARRTENRRKRLGERLAVAFPQFLGELEKDSNLNILLRTCGTLLGAVASLLVILYVLNSIYASRGMIIGLGWAMAVLGGFLGPVIILTLSLICGLFARFVEPGPARRFAGFVSIWLFLLGATLFAAVAYAIQQAIQLQT
jgi:hypothetical protein